MPVVVPTADVLSNLLVSAAEQEFQELLLLNSPQEEKSGKNDDDDIIFKVTPSVLHQAAAGIVGTLSEELMLQKDNTVYRSTLPTFFGRINALLTSDLLTKSRWGQPKHEDKARQDADNLLFAMRCRLDHRAVDMLFSRGCHLASDHTNANATMLHYVCDKTLGYSAALVEQLIASGADSNAVTVSGIAPLHVAIMSCNWDAAHTLLASNSITSTQLNTLLPNGSYPLALAAHNRAPDDILAMMMAAGAVDKELEVKVSLPDDLLREISACYRWNKLKYAIMLRSVLLQHPNVLENQEEPLAPLTEPNVNSRRSSFASVATYGSVMSTSGLPFHVHSLLRRAASVDVGTQSSGLILLLASTIPGEAALPCEDPTPQSPLSGNVIIAEQQQLPVHPAFAALRQQTADARDAVNRLAQRAGVRREASPSIKAALCALFTRRHQKPSAARVPPLFASVLGIPTLTVMKPALHRS